jgi:hypothetical protein
MTMPDALARRQTGDLIFPQEATQEFVQHTQAKLDTVRSLVGMGITEYDLMYGQMKAYVEKGGRTPDHQKHIVERGAHLLNIHNVAVDTIIRGAISDTLDNRYVREVEVTRIREVPQRGIIPKLFGR